MGGGGSYYDRDVTDSSRRTAAGYSDLAEQTLSRSNVNPAVLPKNRRLTCEASGPIVYAFDVTGSMGTLPKIIYDKMPLIAGQTAELGYVKDPMMCLAAVGDTVSDAAPLQVGDFVLLRSLDDWLSRLWLEGGGGGQSVESYEMMAYFFATRCEIPNAQTPIFLFTGDEGFRDRLYKNELVGHFGGEHVDVAASEVFSRLRKRFADNVFLIHKTYAGSDAEIVSQWQAVLGKERVVLLEDDLAIGDVTLGLFALVGGTRTLYEYVDDMRTKRWEPQAEERVAQVRRSLEPLAAFLGRTGDPRTTAPAPRTDGAGKKDKPGRI